MHQPHPAPDDLNSALAQAEVELRAAQAAVVESSDDAIISKTLQGIIRTWNKGAERMFGYTSDEVVGKSITILIPPERIDEETEILSRLRRGERIEHFETVRMRKDGTLLDISLTISPVRDESGRIIGASKIARDVTSRKRTEAALRDSEARLRAVVDATPDCVMIVAPDGSLVFMNSAGLRLIEADDLESARNACVFEWIAPEHRSEWMERHARICGGERMSWEFEIVGLKGTRRWMESHSVPLPLTGGTFDQLAVTREITARKRAEAEREHLLSSERTARAEAERVSLLKDEFLATLSHELRTPLNAILGWAQILHTHASQDPGIAEGISVIERNSRVQAQLIEDLLDMSRIISGKLRLDVQQVDTQDVVNAAIASVRHSADAKRIDLQLMIDPLAGPVRGDAGRLQQCVWNLLTNAIKFTPRGGKVQVTLERANSHVQLCVADNGQGIRPEFLPHLFERFRQADASTTRRHGGLGLGLSIVKHLIELHGGSVWAKSAGEGKGATFCIELPIAVMQSADSRSVPELKRDNGQEAVVTNQLPSLHGLTILAVDDDPDARGLIRRVLEDSGAKVIMAASASEAMEWMERERPQMILSDIGMPGEDGYSLIRKVRSLSPEAGGRTPAAALTAFARSEDRMRALRAGYQTHVAKPVDPAELVAVVASLAIRS